MSKPLIIALVGVFAIVAIVVTVVLLVPNSKIEEKIIGKKNIEQKNLIADISNSVIGSASGLINSLFGNKK